MSKVLIVGAGTTGLVLAVFLKQNGIDIKIIDKFDPSGTKFSKALTVNAASLKAFHGLGLAPAFLKHGKKILKADIFFKKNRVATVNKKYLNGIYNFYLSIPQLETEHLLEKALKNYLVYVDYQQELTNITQSEEQAEVLIKDLKNNKNEIEYFDFVVGCDGAHSTVRKSLGIPFIGNDYNVSFIIGDVIFYEDFFLSHATYYVNEEGFLGLFPMNNSVRVVAQKKCRLSEAALKPTKEDLQQYLNIYLPNKLSVKRLLWSSNARIINRLASSYQVGRVFLAGDACHLFSPVGGQGMNTGIQDAFDLGWKLSHHLNGIAKKSLLETYEKDRVWALKKILKSVDLYTKLIIGTDDANEKSKIFYPSFANRRFYKKELPEEFSGYKADYSKKDGDILGRHIPYWEFKKRYFNLNSTYDLPQLKKYILFTLGETAENIESKMLFSYSKAIINIKISQEETGLIRDLYVDKKHMCLVSPSGYIVAHGKLSNIIQYLEKYCLAS